MQQVILPIISNRALMSLMPYTDAVVHPLEKAALFVVPLLGVSPRKDSNLRPSA